MELNYTTTFLVHFQLCGNNSSKGSFLLLNMFCFFPKFGVKELDFNTCGMNRNVSQDTADLAPIVHCVHILLATLCEPVVSVVVLHLIHI